MCCRSRRGQQQAASGRQQAGTAAGGPWILDLWSVWQAVRIHAAANPPGFYSLSACRPPPAGAKRPRLPPAAHRLRVQSDPNMTNFLDLALVLWLLPCAFQDYRTRRVSNWLTVPAFFGAWPLALWLGGSDRLAFVLAVFAGCWFAWQMKGMGAADGKMATALAAVSPPALGISVLLLTLGFVRMRLWNGKRTSLPAGVAFYGGMVGNVLMQVSRTHWIPG